MAEGEVPKIPGYRGILAWQKGTDLVESVYRATWTFPREERFGLTTQVQRAAVSISSNIAEGSGRGSSAEFSRFISIAYGSLCELETQLYIAQRLEYIDVRTLNQLLSQTTEVARLLHGFQRSLKARTQQLTTND